MARNTNLLHGIETSFTHAVFALTASFFSAVIGLYFISKSHNTDIRALEGFFNGTYHDFGIFFFCLSGFFLFVSAISIALNVRRKNQAFAHKPGPGRSRYPVYVCPLCGADMILKILRQEGNEKAEFWTCSEYPRCKGTLKRMAGQTSS